MRVIETNGKPIKHWTKGLQFEKAAQEQLTKLAELPFIYKQIAVMPDVHAGVGSTIGTVLATQGAIIPAAVGVDLGCGMMAVKTSLMASDLPDSLLAIRIALEAAIPAGSYPGTHIGSWNQSELPITVRNVWDRKLADGFRELAHKHPQILQTNNIQHLGTLGGGNHFVEICIDESESVWVMLHTGSRGVGNFIGRFFIEKARNHMESYFIHLPDKDMAYLPDGTQDFKDYCAAVEWAQNFARLNRDIMMFHVLNTLANYIPKTFTSNECVVSCHHNYIQKEHHFGKNVWVTRKGAVSAKKNELGIIPGSMGAKSFIVRGLGNVDSFHSCSHGAGRVMSRTKAKQVVNLTEHQMALDSVECRKDESTIDETPSAYKDIDKVMAAQNELVEIVHTLKQVLCIKG